MNDEFSDFPDAPAQTAKDEFSDFPDAPQATPSDYSNVPWSDVGKQALENFPSSAANQIGAAFHAVTHPIETAQTIGQIGKGLVSKATAGLGGVSPFTLATDVPYNVASQPELTTQTTPQERAQNEGLINAIGQHYAENYGSVGGLKKAIATDPASVGMDVASIASPALGVISEAPGALGTISRIGQTTAQMADPTQAALMLAGKGTSAVSNLAGGTLKTAQSVLSGVPKPLLEAARSIGKSGDPVGVKTLNKFLTNQSDHTEIAQTAMNAVDELRNKASNSYLADKANFAKSQQELPMDKIWNAYQQVHQELNPPGTNTLFPNAQKSLNDIENQILDVNTSNEPARRTMNGLDQLKRSINDTINSTSDPALKGKFSNITRAIYDTINDQDPQYAKTMQDWQDWRNKLQDYQKTLGTSDKTAATSSVAKMLKSTKTSSGNDLLNELSSTDAGKYLPHMLTGVAGQDWVRHGGVGALEALTGIAGAALRPSALPGILGGAALSSPRLSVQSQRAIGVSQRHGAPVVPALDAATSLPATVAAEQLGTERATGGRIGRATGGSVKIDHAAKAASLIRKAEQAQKQHANNTEPMLDIHDNQIAHALAVVNKHI